jgi:hypothetical protein
VGKALKKNQDYTTLNHMKWAAWGVIDIEKLERMQRRNYINAVREELKLHGCALECGGGNATHMKHYRVIKHKQAGVGVETPVQGIAPEWSEVTGFEDRKAGAAFARVCYRALCRLDPDFAKAKEEAAV